MFRGLKIIHGIMGMNYGQLVSLHEQLLFDTEENASLALQQDERIKWTFFLHVYNCISYAKTLKESIFVILDSHFDANDEIVKKAKSMFEKPYEKIIVTIRNKIDHGVILSDEFVVQEASGKYTINMVIDKNILKHYGASRHVLDSITDEKCNYISLLKSYFDDITELMVDIDESIRRKYGIPYQKLTITDKEGNVETLLGTIPFEIKITRDIEMSENGPVSKDEKITLTYKNTANHHL